MEEHPDVIGIERDSWQESVVDWTCVKRQDKEARTERLNMMKKKTQSQRISNIVKVLNINIIYI